jgi:ABC-type branched-subunit amino acid transport system ATPase component
VVAVDRVSLKVAAGELRGLIGPNGAGKSTLFNLVIGALRPNAGEVRFEGRRIDRLPAAARARLGVSIAFQSVRLFRGLSVLENVMVGAQAWTAHGFLEAALRLPRHHREERAIRQEAERALAQVGLEDLAGAAPESLPLGRQRSLQIARALCGRPRLLLLDEPASGLRAAERERLSRLLTGLHDRGLTMLLVEHDVAFVTGLADQISVLEGGRVISEGSPDQIQRDERVIAAYLGRTSASA